MNFKNILYFLFKIKSIKQFNYNLPIIILNSLSSYESCTDVSYLNALLQFFIWEDISYVGFQNKICRNKFHSFPDLYYWPKKNKLNLEKCIINFKLFKDLKYNIPLKLIHENYNDILILNNQMKLFL